MSLNYDNNSETWRGFEVKYPDLGDGEPVDWKPLLDAITVSSYLTDNAVFREKVATYFDLPVFLDYYLFIELMLASDNQGKNAYFSVYNQKKSPMITVSPWDLDGTWGRRWDGSPGVTGPEQDFDRFVTQYEHGQNNLFLRLKALNFDNYNDKLKERYRELRGSLFSYESLMERFERYYDLFVKSGAAVREQNKWYIGDFAYEMQFLSQWIQSRLAYLDNQYLGGPYTSIGNKMNPNKRMILNQIRNSLTLSNLNAGDRVEIMSLQGCVIYLMQAAGAEALIDMNRYAPGVYLVKIDGNVAKIVKK
jgi:spore coat protein CotH